jgi:hypothetical protein
MSLFTLTKEQFEHALNKAKEVTISAMVREEIIDVEEAMYFLENYAVVLIRKNWLGKLIDRFRGLDNDEAGNYRYQVVRLVDYESTDEEKDKPDHLKVVPLKVVPFKGNKDEPTEPDEPVSPGDEDMAGSDPEQKG